MSSGIHGPPRGHARTMTDAHMRRVMATVAMTLEAVLISPMRSLPLRAAQLAPSSAKMTSSRCVSQCESQTKEQRLSFL